ncbi:MAG: YbbR-like domain-containing protein [Eubacteriaceae bacterium]|nr:YbbR-like domain-containing protein [Eubacteriaceae bacterium]
MKKASKNKSGTNVKIVISIIISVALWIYVIGDQDPRQNQRYNNIPVEITNEEVLAERGLVLTENVDYTVDITVNGRTSSLYELKWTNIKAKINVGDINKKGSYDLAVEISGIPEGIDLISITPSQITVDVDRMGDDTKAVMIEITGAPKEGMSTLGYTTDPASVSLDGPEDVLSSIKMISGKVDVDGADKDVAKTSELKAYDADGNEISNVKIFPSKVDVVVSIGKVAKVDVQTVTQGSLPEGYAIKSITAVPSSVTIGAKSEILGGVTSVKTEPIDISSFTGNVEKTVGLVLPEGVSIINGNNAIKVSITIEKVVRKQFVISRIRTINKPSDLVIDDNQFDMDVQVTLTGLESDINKLTTDKIILYTDLKGIGTGNNVLQIQMEPIDKISLIAMTPAEITVNASR